MDLSVERLTKECCQVNSQCDVASLLGNLLGELYLYMLDHCGTIDPAMRIGNAIDKFKQYNIK